MNILVLSPYIPAWPASGSPTRVVKLLEQLADRFRITLALVTWGRNPPEPVLRNLETICRRVEMLPVCLSPFGRCMKIVRRAVYRQPAGAATFSTVAGQIFPRIHNLISHGDFGAIHAEDGMLAGILEALPACGARKVLSLHNLDSIRHRRCFVESTGIGEKAEAYWEWRAYERAEQRFGRAADFILAVSEREAQRLSAYVPESKIAVVPNGVDTSYFQRRSRTASGALGLLFTGHIGWRPNVRAVCGFHRWVLPLVKRQIPNVRLKIVGMQPAREVLALGTDSDVEVTGWVDDVRPHFEAADVFITPLRSGSGTRLKILEAWAMETPVVSTSIGAEGLHGRHGRHLLIADAPEAFAEAAVELLRNRPLARRLTEAGRALAEREYDWRVVGRTLREVYDRVLAVDGRWRMTGEKSSVFHRWTGTFCGRESSGL